MPGKLNKVSKYWNPFAALPAYENKYMETIDAIKTPVGLVGTAVGFIPVVGGPLSAAISVGMGGAEIGGKIYQLNEAGFDWNYLYDWEGLAKDPEQRKLLWDVMTGKYNGPPAPTNKWNGNFSGNFSY
jgi:hypothetical protein